MNQQQLLEEMKLCPQNKNQSVLGHGESVWDHTCALKGIFDGVVSDREFRLPLWFNGYRHEIASSLYDEDILRHYTVNHDCGKPFCRVEDEDGVHFPDHANVSKKIYQETYDFERMIVGNLIGWDMVLHTATSEEISNYLAHEWTRKDAVTLLIVALAEVHSNARMFGGIESVSFKSKWKQIDRRGKQILKHYFGDKS